MGWTTLAAAACAVAAGTSGALAARVHPSASEPLPPPNFFVDPHPPFYIGVSSGDPLPDSVILWTRATPRTEQEVANGTRVHWRVWSPAEGTSEMAPSLQGNYTAPPERDYTVKVEAAPLSLANTTYFYRFYHEFRSELGPASIAGERSRLGRTRTAPADDVQDGLLTFGYTSCTHQGWYLNALAHLAHNMTMGGEVDPALRPPHTSVEPDENLLYESEAISAMLSGGDSLYDYNAGPRSIRQWANGNPDREVENAELVLDPAFAPLPLLSQYNESWADDEIFYSFTTFPLNIDEWRWLHIMVRLDPDRRAGFAAHPWIHIADSHEGGPQGQSNATTTSLQAFDWYTPTRVRFETHPLSGEQQMVLYRQFRFGKLANLVVVDARGIGRMQPENTFLGAPQRDWLINDVFRHPRDGEGWRIMMTGKPITDWRLNGYVGLAVGSSVGILLFVLACVACCVVARRRRLAEADGLAEIVALDGKSPGSGADESAEFGLDESRRAAQVLPLALARARRGCLTCCASKLCLAVGVFWVVAVLSGAIGFLVFAGNQPRMTTYPEVGSVSVFGEIINWVGSPVDRAELFKDMWDNNSTRDNLWLVGDNHMLNAANVRLDTPGHAILEGQAAGLLAAGRNVFEDYSVFDETTAKLGAEWLPSSTSSHGIYDMMLGISSNLLVARTLSSFIEGVLMRFNSHWTMLDSAAHGIGYVHVTAAEARMEFFRSDIYFPFRETVKYWSGEVIRGANEWGPSRSHAENWEAVGGPV